MRHDQCGAGQACVLGVCERGALDEPFDAAPLRAARWYSERFGGTSGGSGCSTDDECGPWACSDGVCVDPAETGRPTISRRELAYWDGSCEEPDDCGSWVCAAGYCHPDENLNPARIETGDDGVACLGDDECAADSDCAAPGICRQGLSELQMTFDDLADLAADTCSMHADCGPWLCVGGECITPEAAGAEPPLRGEILFWDASCNTSADCGPWSCDDGWCRPGGF